MKRKLIVASLALVMFSGLCILENAIIIAKPKEANAKGASSVYMLAGEFRTVFANLLWIKADNYHDEYVQRNSDWTKNEDLLGMINLIVALDPHFVEAYSVGASLYASGSGGNKRAFKWLQEGVKNNPRSWELHRDIAIICARHFDSPRPAFIHAQLAESYCEDSFYKESLRKLMHTIQKEIDEREKNKAL